MKTNKKYVTYLLTRVTDVNTEQQMCVGNCTGRPQSQRFANSLLGRLQNLSQMGLKHSLFLIPIISIILFVVFRFNSIQALSETSFAGLTKLELLMIHGNDIPSIPDGALRDLGSLQVNLPFYEHQ